MKITRPLWNTISSKTLPITKKEFSDALARKWRPPQARSGPQARETIGLAISGGVDSMALAALCSHLQNPPDRRKWRKVPSKKPVEEKLWPDLMFRAFVVDHDVRSGSDAEARAVAEVLEARGIPTQVLKIEWPHFRNPKDAPNFESYARRYRFRILGKACRDLDIDSLLLAHHEDDQAETVLLRLLAGQRRMGLAGIREQSGIPENYGVYGIHESGGRSSENPSKSQDQTQFMKRILKSMKWTPESPKHLTCESGGIKIYRPLLSFSKARLIATCEAEEMKWFEDYTNKDPTLTTRNAIRHMYSNYSMPAAISKESLIQLSTRVTKRNEMRAARVVNWAAQCNIQNFETRTGTLTAQFPDMNLLFTAKKRSTTEKSRIAAELLRRILMLVTPEEHVEVSSLYGAVARLFPEIHNPEAAEQSEETQTDAGFTVSGVQFQPVTQEPQAVQDTPIPTRLCGKEMKPSWLLSRQPLPSTSSRPLITIPPSYFSGEGSWSDWKLFDGRYWIRVQNLTDSTISIVPFERRYWSELKHSLGKTYRRVAENLLKEKARGNVRWTLPVIVLPTNKWKGGKADEAIALPTLGVAVVDVEKMVRWEVRYKKIDMTGLSIDRNLHTAESGNESVRFEETRENPYIRTISK